MDIGEVMSGSDSFTGDVFFITSGSEIFLSGNVVFSGYLESDMSSDSLSGENSDTTSQAVFSPIVKFIEIYPKDTDFFGEYIGLQFSRSFDGTLDISGLGNGSSVKSITVQVTTGEIVFVTDSPEKIQSSSGVSLSILSSLTLTDSGEPLQITIGDIIQDKVLYSVSSISQAISCSELITDDGYRLCNELISPSLFSSFGFTSTGGENVQLSGTISSGGTLPGNNNENGNTPPPGETGSGFFTPFRIEEVYPYDTLYPEYIELVALEKYSGAITISGLGQGSSSKTISLETLPGIKWIVTKDPTKFSFTPFVIGVSGISLLNNGEEISLFLPDGHEIDRVVYSGQEEMYSALFSDTFSSNENKIRGFFTFQQPTPGYTRDMVISHIPPPQEPPHCGIYRQHTNAIFSDKKINLQATADDILLQNTQTTYSCERLFSGSEVVYDTGCNPSYIAFAPGLWPVSLRISKNNESYCEVSQQLNLPGPQELPSKKETSSYYEGLYKKRKEKYEGIVSQIKINGLNLSSSGQLLGITKDLTILLPEELLITGGGPQEIRIHSVLPNPVGKDTEGERLIIENLTDEVVYSEDLMLVKGTSSTGFPEGRVLLPGKYTEIVGNFGLPNKPMCIGVRYRNDKKIVTNFCYPQLSEGEVYTGGLPGFSSLQEQERLQDLSLTLETSSACVYIDSQEVACVDLPYLPSEVKELKKQVKKLPSLEKKIVSLQEKYDLWREKYATLSKNNKKREAGYLQKNRDLRSVLSLEKNQKEMFRSFYRLLQKKVGKERTPLYELPSMVNIKTLYDNLAFLKDTPTLAVGPISMEVSEVELWYDFYFEGKMPAYLRENMVHTISYLTTGVKSTEHLFLSLFIK